MFKFKTMIEGRVGERLVEMAQRVIDSNPKYFKELADSDEEITVVLGVNKTLGMTANVIPVSGMLRFGTVKNHRKMLLSFGTTAINAYRFNREMESIMFHELIHVRQFATGQVQIVLRDGALKISSTMTGEEVLYAETSKELVQYNKLISNINGSRKTVEALSTAVSQLPWEEEAWRLTAEAYPDVDNLLEYKEESMIETAKKAVSVNIDVIRRIIKSDVSFADIMEYSNSTSSYLAFNNMDYID